MATQQKLLTAEEFFWTVSSDEPCELVRGEVVLIERPGYQHGSVVMRVCYLLRNYVDNHDIGQVAWSGVITERDPDTVRGADVMFHSYDRIPKGAEIVQYPTVSPNVVFEVRSPSDRWPNIHEKVTEYLQVGVDCVVVLDPEDQTARLFYTDRGSETLTAEDELILPAPLDGFRERVSRFFE